MKWIKIEDQSPPKDKVFLFSYFYGIGLACWGQCFTTINGNSERTHEAYILILNPDLMVGNQGEPMEWDEECMKTMEVSWMPLPNPPEEENEYDKILQNVLDEGNKRMCESIWKPRQENATDEGVSR